MNHHGQAESVELGSDIRFDNLTQRLQRLFWQAGARHPGERQASPHNNLAATDESLQPAGYVLPSVRGICLPPSQGQALRPLSFRGVAVPRRPASGVRPNDCSSRTTVNRDASRGHQFSIAGSNGEPRKVADEL